MKFLLRVMLTPLAPLLGAVVALYGFCIVTKVMAKSTWSSEYRAKTIRMVELLKNLLEGPVEELKNRLG